MERGTLFGLDKGAIHLTFEKTLVLAVLLLAPPWGFSWGTAASPDPPEWICIRLWGIVIGLFVVDFVGHGR